MVPVVAQAKSLWLAVVGRPIRSRAVMALLDRYSMVPDDSHVLSIYWEAPHAGIEILENNGVVDTVFLHAEGRDDYTAYRGPLPGGVRFGMSRSEARTCLGEPEWSGPVLDVPGLGPSATDRYRLDELVVSLAHDAPGFGLALVVLAKG